MDAQILLGAGIVVFAGFLQGVFAVPMKFAHRWSYENIWLVFAFSGLIVFPWVLTLATVPLVVEIYRLISTKTIGAVVGFGLCWGAGATLTGLGLNMLGIGLGFAIILGLSAALGSLVPLLVLTPEKLATSQGHLYLIGTTVMLAGIAIASRAGFLRDRLNKPDDSGQAVTVRGSFVTGLIVAISAGLLSSALNFSYAFGTEALVQARCLGVSPVWISNVVAAPATTGGFVANCIFCVYLLRKNSTFGRFWIREARINWFYGTLMGAFWFGGLAAYGIGVFRMGNFGTVIGWPLLMGTIIVTSNAAGMATGEWSGAGTRIRTYLVTGMVIILLALWILALAQKP